MNWLTGLRATCLLGACIAGSSLSAAEETPTVIESGNAEMVSTETESTFTFRDGVTVTGANLKIICDNLVVVANRTGDAKATIGNQERFKSLIATGNVRITQNDREATCQRAEVLPGADKVILSGGRPKVRTTDGAYSEEGDIIELLRGERRVRVLGGPGGRTRFQGPQIKDLGYDEKQEAEKERAEKEKAEKEKQKAAVPMFNLPTTPPQK